jgi:Type IV secretion-system coupling protein DNA-binding domain
MNMIDKKEVLEKFDLLDTKGFSIGSMRFFDLGNDFINEIIEAENQKIEVLGQYISPENQALYNRISNKFLNYDGFITSNKGINDKTYKRDLEGYFEYMKDENPPLANFFLDWIEPYFSDNVRNCHTYITGASSSGKSELMKSIIINHIIKSNCSIVLIEPHGDLAKQIYKSKIFLEPQQAERLIIIEPNFDSHLTPIINIFDQFNIKNEFDLDKISQEYTKTFATIFEDLGEVPTGRMKTILGHCITVILRKKDSSIRDLLRFMTTDNADLIDLGAKDQNQTTADFFRNEFENETYKHTKNGIYDRLQGLLKNQIFTGLTTGNSTINLPNSINTNKVVILNLSRGGIGTEVSQAFGRLIISIVQITGLQRDELRPENRPTTHLFIDEFQNYISDTIKEILEELRKYKVFITLANQYVGQDLNTNEVKSILGNTKIKIIGQSSYGNSTSMAREMQIKPEQITDLNRGEFYIQYPNTKTGKQHTIRIKGTAKYLGDSFCMTNKAYNDLKTAQIKRFYVERLNHTPSNTKAPQNENKQAIKGSFNKARPKYNEPSPDLDLDL